MSSPVSFYRQSYWIVLTALVCTVVFDQCVSQSTVTSPVTRSEPVPKYFPAGAFFDPNFPKFEKLTQGHDSEQLYLMEEPILYTDSSGTESYRFLWLRSFHAYVAIRIDSNGGGYNLTWKVCERKDNMSVGKLTIKGSKEVNIQTWDEFKQKLDASDFWNLPTNDGRIGLDGSSWILEGRELERYHVISQRSPKEDNPYYIACDFLLSLTDLKIDEKDKY